MTYSPDTAISSDPIDHPYVPFGAQPISRLVQEEAAAAVKGMNRDVNDVLTVGILDPESNRGTQQVQMTGAQALAERNLTGVPHNDALFSDIRRTMVQNSIPQKIKEAQPNDPSTGLPGEASPDASTAPAPPAMSLSSVGGMLTVGMEAFTSQISSFVGALAAVEISGPSVAPELAQAPEKLRGLSPELIEHARDLGQSVGPRTPLAAAPDMFSHDNYQRPPNQPPAPGMAREHSRSL